MRISLSTSCCLPAYIKLSVAPQIIPARASSVNDFSDFSNTLLKFVEELPEVLRLPVPDIPLDKVNRDYVEQ